MLVGLHCLSQLAGCDLIKKKKKKKRKKKGRCSLWRRRKSLSKVGRKSLTTKKVRCIKVLPVRHNSYTKWKKSASFFFTSSSFSYSFPPPRPLCSSSCFSSDVSAIPPTHLLQRPTSIQFALFHCASSSPGPYTNMKVTVRTSLTPRKKRIKSDYNDNGGSYDEAW